MSEKNFPCSAHRSTIQGEHDYRARTTTHASVGVLKIHNLSRLPHDMSSTMDAVGQVVGSSLLVGARLLAARPFMTISTVTLAALIAYVVVKAIVQPYMLVRHYSKGLVHKGVTVSAPMPTLPFRPLVGNLPEIRQLIKQPYSNATDKAFGSVFCLTIGPQVRVNLNTPDFAKEVLVVKADHFVKVRAIAIGFAAPWTVAVAGCPPSRP